MYKARKTIFVFTCLAVIFLNATLLPVVTAGALDPADYSTNDILFYDANDTGADCSTGGSTSSSGSVPLSKNSTLQHIFQALINGGMNAGQAAAVMGNMYHESGFNPDQHEIGNDIGYGLVQWSFERRTSLENFAKSKGVAPSNIDMQLTFLLNEYTQTYKSRLSGSAFAAGTDVAASTKAWMEIFEAPALSPANDPAGLNSARIPAAQKIYDFYKDLAPNSAVATGGCNVTGNSAVAGDIVKTALNYALQTPATNGMTAKTDARNTYQVGKQQYNPVGPNGVPSWSDCGGFIATVMIASGVDPNYPKVGVSVQVNYVESHPDKYKVIQHPTVSDLQPGDILLSNQAGHTTMYTGGSPYTDVDASLDERVPSVRNSGSHVWMISNGAIIARVIK